MKPRRRSERRSVVVIVAGRLKGLLAVFGGYGQRLIQAEAQPGFRAEDRGLAAREQNPGDASNRSDASANSGTCATVDGGSDGCANAGGGCDSGGIGSVRSTARAFPQFGGDGKLLAISGRHVGQFEAKLRNSCDATCFLGCSYGADDGLAAARDDPSVDHDGLIQCGGESIARVIVVARNRLIQPDENDFPCGNGEAGRNIAQRALLLILPTMRLWLTLPRGILVLTLRVLMALRNFVAGDHFALVLRRRLLLIAR